MPANNPVPKARDYDPDGSIDQFPQWVSGRDLARSDDAIAWPDETTREGWQRSMRLRLESSKGQAQTGLRPGETGFIEREGLHDALQQAGRVDMPIDIRVTPGGQYDILSGGHRLAVADDLDLPVRVRWFGRGFFQLADAPPAQGVDDLGRRWVGSMTLDEYNRLKAAFPVRTGEGAYTDFVAPARVAGRSR